MTLYVRIYYKNILWMVSSWDFLCIVIFSLPQSDCSKRIVKLVCLPLLSAFMQCVSTQPITVLGKPLRVYSSGRTLMEASPCLLEDRKRLFEWCGAFGDLCECHRNTCRDKYDSTYQKIPKSIKVGLLFGPDVWLVSEYIHKDAQGFQRMAFSWIWMASCCVVSQFIEKCRPVVTPITCTHYTPWSHMEHGRC